MIKAGPAIISMLSYEPLINIMQQSQSKCY